MLFSSIVRDLGRERAAEQSSSIPHGFPNLSRQAEGNWRPTHLVGEPDLALEQLEPLLSKFSRPQPRLTILVEI